MNTFEELLALDRPFVPVTFKFNGKELNLQARRLSAADYDSLESLHSDTWATLIMEMTENVTGKQSEIEKVRMTYSLRTREELIEQLIGTRYQDMQARAEVIVGKTINQFVEDASHLGDADERVAYLTEGKRQLDEAVQTVHAELFADYDLRPTDDLIKSISDVNVNMKALVKAGQVREAARIYFSVYTEDASERFFPSETAVLKLQPETVQALSKAIDHSFIAQVPSDFPFDLPSDQEQSGPQPSPKSTEADTKASGKRTPRRQKS
jgi:hypothetical protein